MRFVEAANHSRRRSDFFRDIRFWFLPKSNQIYPNLTTPNFASILHKSNKIFSYSPQFCPNLINFNNKIFARVCSCIPSSYGYTTLWDWPATPTHQQSIHLTRIGWLRSDSTKILNGTKLACSIFFPPFSLQIT